MAPSTTPKRTSDPERLQGLLEKLKAENATLREALEGERGAVRELKRRMALELRAAREEAARKQSDCLCDLRQRLEHDHQEALQAQKEAVARSLHSDLTRALSEKDAELRQSRAQALRHQEELRQQLRDALRCSAASELVRTPQHEHRGQVPTGEHQSKARPVMNQKRQSDPERLQGLLEKLKAENASLREALEGERGAVRELKRRMAEELRTAREEAARKQSDCLCDMRQRLEHEHQEALQAQKEAVARSMHADLTRALNEKDAEMRQVRAQAQRHEEELRQQLRDMLRNNLEFEQTQMTSKYGSRVMRSVQEMERLRSQVEERDKEIAALRQAAQEKDQKLDYLSSKCRKEQLKPFYRFMELQPVSELEEEEENGDGESLGASSLSPPPGWPPEEQVDLQHRCQVLESCVRRAEARSSRLQELRRTSADHAQQLQAEAVELREHSDLLEFRVLELEEALKQRSQKTGPDKKDVCTDTENDDISDSGMTSLPTSDDLTSDTDLGVHDLKLERAFKDLSEFRLANNNFSKFSGRIVATVLPFTDVDQTTTSTDSNEEPSATESQQPFMQLKNAECLQESGIFESDYVECGTQTDAAESRVDVDEEIHKLGLLQECIESKTLMTGRKDELAFCRERLNLLEAKVLVYESSGDAQARLLSERLQREVVLAAQVKELSSRVERLQADKLRLEEERCEFEEAENDTRLRCQKMEVKLQALTDKKSELQALLQQERRCNETLQKQLQDSELHSGSFETQISKLEQRNYELEERTMELRHRLELEEGAWPVIQFWRVWRALECNRHGNTRQCPLALKDKAHSSPLEMISSFRHTSLPPKEDTLNIICSNALMGLNYSFQNNSVLPQQKNTEADTSNSFESLYMKDTPDLPKSVPEEVKDDENYKTVSDLRSSMLPINEVEPEVPDEQHTVPIEPSSETFDLPMKNCCDGEREDKNLDAVTEEELDLVSINENINQSKQLDGMPTELLDLWKSRELEVIYLRRISELEEELRSLKMRSKSSTPTKLCKTSDPCYQSESSTETGGVDPNDEAVDAIKLQDIEWMDRLDELAQAEINMQNRIAELEQKETAYMETLRQADDLWSDLEAGYKNQIEELRASEAELRERLERASSQSDEVLELEQTASDLQVALRKSETDKATLTTKMAHLADCLAAAEANVERLQKEVEVDLKPRLTLERRLSADLQKDLKHKNDTIDAMQDSYDKENVFQIERLINQLAASRRDCINSNTECSRLREEIEDLKRRVRELKCSLAEQKMEDERTLVELTNRLAGKECELQTVLMASRDALARSARDEIAEADAIEDDDEEDERTTSRTTSSVHTAVSQCKDILQVCSTST